MHIALGYRWFPTAAGHHLERALHSLGHAVTFVGLGEGERCGYGETTSLARIVASLPDPPAFYLWIDPTGRYFPADIETLPTPTACYLIDVHLGHWRNVAAQFFDVVLVAQKDHVAQMRQIVGHDQVYWLPLAAAVDVHYDHRVPRIYDVGFVGNILRILVLAFLTRPLWENAGTIINAVGKPRLTTRVTIIWVMVLAIFGLPMTLVWGTVGTSIAVGIAALFGLTLLLKTMMDVSPVDPRSTLAVTTVLAVGALVLYYLFGLLIGPFDVQLTLQVVGKMGGIVCLYYGLAMLVSPRTTLARLRYVWRLVWKK